MEIGKKLKDARKDNNYTQIQVAEITKINRTSISKIESGDQEPNIEQLRKLIELYGLNANWLLEVGKYNDDL